VIRTLIVDDHPAVLQGIVAALRAEPGFVPVATAIGVSAALRQAERRRPDVALVDYHLADGDGLSLCHELKRLAQPPEVLIYSAFAEPHLRVAASVAGADGMVDKGAPLDDLFAALRTVARGGKALPPLRPSDAESSVTRLDPEDLPILGMRMDDVPLEEIASVLRLGEAEVSRRTIAMIGRLAAPREPRYMDPDTRLGATTD
jgi:DNA-binding NarL/FixJ family response regulator